MHPPSSRMRQSLIVLAVAATLTGHLPSAAATEPIWVTVKQLLASSKELDGKRISVIGYYVNSFESGSHLFANAKTSKNSKGADISIDESVLFNPGTVLNPAPPLPGVSAVCELTKHYVRITGTFHSTKANVLRRPEVTHIVNFRVARITPDDPFNPCGMYHKKSKDH